MEKPLWITIEDTFEGHQGHWANIFFSNATFDAIVAFCTDEGWRFRITLMTKEQIEQFPEIINIVKELNEEYS